jgi:hypothetical protein
MSRAGKIALGAATVWPLLYMIIFFVSVFALMFAFSAGEPAPADHVGPPVWFFGLFALHFLTMLWVLGLTAFYIVNVFRNERVEKDKKALWAVVLFLGSIFAMPAYWYLYIWREPDAPPLAGTPFGR